MSDESKNLNKDINKELNKVQKLNDDKFLFKDPSEFKMSPIREMKEKMISNYRLQHQGIVEKLEKSAAGYNTDQLLTAIIEEIFMTYEDLFGNILVLESNGDLQASSSITLKRADLLKSIAEIASRKKELNQRNGDVDLNSPAFCIFQKICFEKMIEALQDIDMDKETVNLFLSSWQDKMQNWDKELKSALKELEE